MADNNQRQPTTTQIRNLYSEGNSSMRIMFYNMNISIQLQPFMGKNQNGISQYDYQKSITTTIDWSGAFALYVMANEIINGGSAADGMMLVVPCNQAQITLDRRAGANGTMETWVAITKDNNTIPFKFITHQGQIKENGQMVQKTIESGLGTFMKTLDGYLTGINSDRHLDKLTEDYVKSLGDKAQTQGQGFQTGSGYKGGGNKNWNNNRGGGNNRNWNNNRGNYNNQNQGAPASQQSWEGGQQQQNMSNYTLPQ